VYGKLAVTPGEQLSIIVGKGGRFASDYNFRTEAYGLPGVAGITGAEGGGYSGIKRGSTYILYVGAGGGASGSDRGGAASASGAGFQGGSTGIKSALMNGQNTGGGLADGSQGSSGSIATYQSSGGGGGGGYGGGGAPMVGGYTGAGGGGSSYSALLTETTLSDGAANVPGNATDILRGTAGNGGTTGAGSDGAIILDAVQSTPTYSQSATVAVDISSNLVFAATSNVRIAAPTDWRYVTSDVGATSLTLATSNTGVLYRLTNTGFNALTLPADQSIYNSGIWWQFHNTSGANLSVTLTNSIGLTSPQTLSNNVSYTLYWNGTSNYLVDSRGPTGATGPTGAASTVTGPTGVAGTTGPAGATGFTGPGANLFPATSSYTVGTNLSDLTSRVAFRYPVTEVSGTSLIVDLSSNYNRNYYISNSGFNSLTLPSATPTTFGGVYWTLRNATAANLSITVTNTLTLASPLVIPSYNIQTLVVSDQCANTILLF
jgi:hypothetical protein